MAKRVFLIVLDSFGIGEMPDAAKFGDEGSNTLASIVKSEKYATPMLQKMGLFNIEGVACGKPAKRPLAAFARLAEVSAGKDTTTGHWELAGAESAKPLPVYPGGFPIEVIRAFEEKNGAQNAVQQALFRHGCHSRLRGRAYAHRRADCIYFSRQRVSGGGA